MKKNFIAQIAFIHYSLINFISENFNLLVLLKFMILSRTHVRHKTIFFLSRVNCKFLAVHPIKVVIESVRPSIDEFRMVI